MKRTILTDEELKYISCYFEACEVDQDGQDRDMFKTIIGKCNDIVKERFYRRVTNEVNKKLSR